MIKITGVDKMNVLDLRYVFFEDEHDARAVVEQAKRANMTSEQLYDKLQKHIKTKNIATEPLFKIGLEQMCRGEFNDDVSEFIVEDAILGYMLQGRTKEATQLSIQYGLGWKRPYSIRHDYLLNSRG